MGDNNTILSHIFTRNMLKGMVAHDSEATSGLLTIVKRYHIHSENSCYGDVISEIYEYLVNNYRNEYFYKNTLLNKLIIKAHRLKTTVALTEVPIAKSKADFVLINGKAIVYEIKTELDTFDRLQTQIRDYYKAFDHVCVVTSEEQYEELTHQLDNTSVGIYVLTKKGAIRRVKEPDIETRYLEKESIFKVLNKSEYESIVIKLSGSLPDVTPVHYYKECKRIVLQYSIEEVYPLFLAELKKRNRIDIVEYNTVPKALQFLVYFGKYKKKDYSELQRFLEQPFDRS